MLDYGMAKKVKNKLGDGKHGGPGKTHKYCEREHSAEFQGQGILRPADSDGRSAGMDGVVEGSVTVDRTRYSGKQDPKDGKR